MAFQFPPFYTFLSYGSFSFGCPTSPTLPIAYNILLILFLSGFPCLHQTSLSCFMVTLIICYDENKSKKHILSQCFIIDYFGSMRQLHPNWRILEKQNSNLKAEIYVPIYNFSLFNQHFISLALFLI